MKKFVLMLVLMLGGLSTLSVQVDNLSSRKEMNTIKLTIEGGQTFTATLVDNSSTQALKEQLAKGDITV